MNKLINIESRRYIGNKYKLKDWIMSLINRHCIGSSFADIFAGTGAISAEAVKYFEHVVVNDLLHSNYICYQAFFGSGVYNQNKITEILYTYNHLNPSNICDNYFSINFSGKYFSHRTSKLIGYIREDIENKKQKLTSKEYYILLASLIYSLDRIANTVGHYDAYIKKGILEDNFVINQIKPYHIKKVDIFRQDANTLVNSLKSDIVYIDPPYNSRQYGRFYHILENVAKWDKPQLYGVALKPETENASKYCTAKAPTALAELVNNLKCKYIVVSYNNTYKSKSSSSKNKISLEQIKEILESRGTTSLMRKQYRFFNSGKTDFPDHKEYLFITKVS